MLTMTLQVKSLKVRADPHTCAVITYRHVLNLLITIGNKNFNIISLSLIAI